MTDPKKLTIKDWAEEDRPREKLLLKGKKSLSNAELIAVLLGSGSSSQSAVDLAKQILTSSGNDLHKLAQLDIGDLRKFKGIGEAKAVSIVSALELGRRRKDAETTKQYVIRSSSQAYEFLKEDMQDLPHEEFWVILLRHNHSVIKKELISRGGTSATYVDPKIIFKKALGELSGSIILAHNHPSGNLNPSEPDKALTQKIKNGGKLLDIHVTDHIICTNSGYFSFLDADLL